MTTRSKVIMNNDEIIVGDRNEEEELQFDENENDEQNEEGEEVNFLNERLAIDIKRLETVVINEDNPVPEIIVEKNLDNINDEVIKNEQTDIAILESEDKHKSNKLSVFYGLSKNNKLHVILKIPDLANAYKVVENNTLFTDETVTTEKAIEFITFMMDALGYGMCMNIVTEYNNNNYNMVKPDGLCGLRAIYMCRKYLENKSKGNTINIGQCDVDLTKENEYNDFFGWIKGKYNYAMNVLEDFRKYCATKKFLDDFASNKILYPEGDHDDIVESYKKTNTCIYKNFWNHRFLYDFIKWYKSFETFIKKNRNFNQKYNGLFIKKQLWFDSTYTMFMCYNENFNVLLFTKQPIHIENPNYNSDYFNLQNTLSTNQNLAILSECTLKNTLFNF